MILLILFINNRNFANGPENDFNYIHSNIRHANYGVLFDYLKDYPIEQIPFSDEKLSKLQSQLSNGDLLMVIRDEELIKDNFSEKKEGLNNYETYIDNVVKLNKKLIHIEEVFVLLHEGGRRPSSVKEEENRHKREKIQKTFAGKIKSIKAEKSGKAMTLLEELDDYYGSGQKTEQLFSLKIRNFIKKNFRFPKVLNVTLNFLHKLHGDIIISKKKILADKLYNDYESQIIETNSFSADELIQLKVLFDKHLELIKSDTEAFKTFSNLLIDFINSNPSDTK